MVSYIRLEQTSGSNTWPTVILSELPSYRNGRSNSVSPPDIYSNAPSETILSSTLTTPLQSSGPSTVDNEVTVSDENDIPSESPSVSGVQSGAEDSRLPIISVSTNPREGPSILTSQVLSSWLTLIPSEFPTIIKHILG